MVLVRPWDCHFTENWMQKLINHREGIINHNTNTMQAIHQAYLGGLYPSFLTNQMFLTSKEKAYIYSICS
jgi:hypothetical protein